MPTWMVVEDEPDIYDVLLAMFEIWGIEGVAFVDGSEALSWIEDVDAGRVRSDLPELAIFDIRLPEVSGPELAARLRKSPILGDIAIVLITAYHMPPSQEGEVMKQSKADLLLYKPLPAMLELREKMDKVIGKHKGVKPVEKPAAAPEQPPASKSDQPASETVAITTVDGSRPETTKPEDNSTNHSHQPEPPDDTQS